MRDTLQNFSLHWHSAGCTNKTEYIENHLKNENIDINTLIQNLANFINLSDRNSFSFRNNSSILDNILLLEKNGKNRINLDSLILENFDFDTLKILDKHYPVINTLPNDIIQRLYQRKYKQLSRSKKKENMAIFFEDTELLLSQTKQINILNKELIILNAVYFLQNLNDIKLFKNIIKEISFTEINPLNDKYKDIINIELPQIMINKKTDINNHNFLSVFFNNPICFKEFDELFICNKPLKEYMDEYFDNKTQKEKKSFHFLHEITFQMEKVLYLKKNNIKRSLENGNNNLHKIFYYLDKEQCVDTINYYISKGDKPFLKNNSGKTPFDIFWENRDNLDLKKAIDNFINSDCLKVISSAQFKNFIKDCKNTIDEDIVKMLSIMYDKKILIKDFTVEHPVINKNTPSRL